jgi:hypothetical protein
MEPSCPRWPEGAYHPLPGDLWPVTAPAPSASQSITRQSENGDVGSLALLPATPVPLADHLASLRLWVDRDRLVYVMSVADPFRRGSPSSASGPRIGMTRRSLDFAAGFQQARRFTDGLRSWWLILRASRAMKGPMLCKI